jgi:hypothetical protein
MREKQTASEKRENPYAGLTEMATAECGASVYTVIIPSKADPEEIVEYLHHRESLRESCKSSNATDAEWEEYKTEPALPRGCYRTKEVGEKQAKQLLPRRYPFPGTTKANGRPLKEHSEL